MIFYILKSLIRQQFRDPLQYTPLFEDLCDRLQCDTPIQLVAVVRYKRWLPSAIK